MNHSFDIGIARQYGVNVAIFLQNIAFWTQHNKANQINFHDGRYWTFNSVDAYTELFPYWSERNLRTIIDTCLAKGLLIKGNYNKIKYDRTKWYALSDAGLLFFPELCSPRAICQNRQMEMTETTNGNDGNDEPIPDNLTDNLNTIIDPIKTLKKYEIKTPAKLTEGDRKFLIKALELLDKEGFTLDEYLKYLTDRCPRSLLPYNMNGKERRNGFGTLLRPSFINDVLNGKWKD